MPKKQSQEDKIKNKISKAGKNGNLLKIWYTDKEGRGTTRLTEPYEIRGGDYFGYCKTRNAIRRFKIDNIAQATISKKKYDPRWEIKTGGMKMNNKENKEVKTASETIDELYKKAGLEAKDAKMAAKMVAKIFGIGLIAAGSGMALNHSRDMIKDIENDGTKLINKAKNKDR